MFEILKEWDRELLIWLHNLPLAKYDSFWLFVTRIDVWTPLFLAIFIFFIKHYGWRKAAFLVLTLILAFLAAYSLTFLAKGYFGRVRPVNESALIPYLRILSGPGDFSFFSGHASSSMAVATLAYLHLKQYSKWYLLLFVWPLVFILSRVMLAVHYPSDVLVGGLVGLLFAIIFFRLGRNMLVKVGSTTSHE